MDQKTLQSCLVDQLRDIYDAEKQLVKAIPKLAKASDSEDLREALLEHLRETQGQVERLERAFDALDVPAKGKPCKGMRGLIEEGSESAGEEEGGVRDVAIIAAAQRVEHYEIAAYGTAKAMAEQLGNTEVARLLEESADEEQAADTKLTALAMAIYEADYEMDHIDSEDESQPRPARKQAASHTMASRKAAR